MCLDTHYLLKKKKKKRKKSDSHVAIGVNYGVALIPTQSLSIYSPQTGITSIRETLKITASF
jgi:hypothetical protein